MAQEANWLMEQLRTTADCAYALNIDGIALKEHMGQLTADKGEGLTGCGSIVISLKVSPLELSGTHFGEPFLILRIPAWVSWNSHRSTTDHSATVTKLRAATPPSVKKVVVALSEPWEVVTVQTHPPSPCKSTFSLWLMSRPSLNLRTSASQAFVLTLRYGTS